MSHDASRIPDAEETDIALGKVDLSEAELRIVGGGLNPQPLPPGLRFETPLVPLPPPLRW